MLSFSRNACPITLAVCITTTFITAHGAPLSSTEQSVASSVKFQESALRPAPGSSFGEKGGLVVPGPENAHIVEGIFQTSGTTHHILATLSTSGSIAMVTGLSYEAVVHEPNRLNLNVLVDDPCTMPGSPILGTAYPITMLTMSSCTLVTCVAVFLFLVFRQCRAHRRFNRTWSKRTVNVYSPTTFRNKRPNLSVSTNSLADTYRTVKHKPSSSSTLYDISEEPTTPLDHTPTTPCLQSPSPPYTPLGRISLLESPTMACFAGPISFCPSQRSETGFLPLKA